jgi:hypothetical protein
MGSWSEPSPPKEAAVDGIVLVVTVDDIDIDRDADDEGGGGPRPGKLGGIGSGEKWNVLQKNIWSD